MDFNDILNFVDKGGTIGLLVVILIGGMRAWWVWGWLYREVVEEKNEWKDIALRGIISAEEAVDIVEKTPIPQVRRGRRR